MLNWIRSLHAPTFFVAFVGVLLSQISVGGASINGQNVDLSSTAGRSAALLLFFSAVVYALTKTSQQP